MAKTKNLKKIGILGPGLLGGSVGLAIPGHINGLERLGWSRRTRTVKRALELGAIDRIVDTPPELAAQCDMVIVASPVCAFQTLFAQIAQTLQAGTIVTDLGSTKGQVCRWARKLLPKGVRFVGSHPMAGGEQQGIDYARADLFEGACCILTPTAGTDPTALATVREFWQKLGMRVTEMSPAAHDRALAGISHLPHVLASALVNASNTDAMRLCGKGFLDTTRIASGPADVWRDILCTNRDQTHKAIERLITECCGASRGTWPMTTRRELNAAWKRHAPNAISSFVTSSSIMRCRCRGSWPQMKRRV